LESDDYGFYPAAITASKGQVVKITFKVRAATTYYGGQDIRSSVFNTGVIAPGGEKTVEFTADQTFEFKSYWPASGVLKATGTVNVN
jgi:hypothetical protein